MKTSAMKITCIASPWWRRVFIACVFAAFNVEARVDRPAIAGWTGTAYHDGGWFTYKMSASGTAMKFDSGTMFLLSPCYSAPIRKVVVKASRSSASDARKLQLVPFAGGTEGAMPSRAFSEGVDAHAFSFLTSDDVRAFRVFMVSGTGDDWILSDICVFYGEKTVDEDAVFIDFAGRLPEPENLRAESIASNALTIAADAVSDASCYRFNVVKLSGTPQTECRENFATAPTLSAGWTFGTKVNASIGMATSSYLDTKTSDDSGALKIEKTKDNEFVLVEILSPEFPVAVSEVSHVTKRASGDSTDEIAVFGRASSETEWVRIGERFPVQTSQKWTTNVVDKAFDCRQVKFVFSASAGSFRPCGIDTLRVVYGGDETLVPVNGGTGVFDEPRLALTGLDTARYSFRVQAVAGAGMCDSSWTPEQVVDLAWADVSVEAPADVAVTASGDTLHVSWDEVESAVRYRVAVTPEAGSEVRPVVADTTSTSAEIRVPALGGYVVTVTAFSPGGVSQATSEGVSAEVTLGSLGALTAEATDVSEITATWKVVPLAERYLAKVYRVSDGAARTLVETKSVMECRVVFSGLDSAGRYIVEVSPQPSDGASLAAESGETDLSAVRFRKTGAATLGTEGWSDDFTSLTNVTKKTELKKTGLDFWQLYKGSGEALELMAATDGSKVAGLYACCDGQKSAASYALASLANESYGCTFGIALANDGDLAIEKGVALSFDMSQRVYRQLPSGYAFEWKVTDGEKNILSDGGWTAETIEATAPYVETGEHPEGEYRQSISMMLATNRRILPGEVLLLRWTHPKVKNGPIMSIDNVRLSYTRIQSALRITVR